MGKTIIEKILAKSSGKGEVSPGEYVMVRARCPVTLGGDHVRRGPGQVRAIGASKIFDPSMVNIVMGHGGVTASANVAEGRRAVKEWAREMGISESRIFDLGRQGVEHIVSGEHCWALPGEVYFSGVNGHTTTLGALGAFAVTLSFETGAYLVTGQTWIRVPETTRIRLTGKMPMGVMARDVFEHAIGQLGGAGAAAQVVEWTGPSVEAMSIDSRFSLCSCILFTGAWTNVINPDPRTTEYAKSRTSQPFDPLVSDSDAHFAHDYHFDISNLEPQIVPPPKRDIVKPISAMEGIKINWGFIGTCANGRLEDMRAAATVLKGRTLHPRVQLNITPGSSEIYLQCAKEGLLTIFAEAKATVAAPSCGMCCGNNTPLARGDVCISSGTCNYPGRMGSREAEIYLGSPVTVAASCIEGRIADPRKHL
ncbi:MAG: aconitase family protein [Chloroflexota bacterium]